MNYPENLNLFNDFDKNYDKVNNNFATYLNSARSFIYFRNLQVIYTDADLEKILYLNFTFTIGTTIFTGPIFNVLFNNINQYIENPLIIFTKETMQPILDGLLPCEINVAENKGDTTNLHNIIVS